MTAIDHRTLTAAGDVAAMLRTAGIAVVRCDPTGSIRRDNNRGEDWLVDLLLASPLVCGEIASHASTWNDDRDPSPQEILPGLWAIATADRVNRRVGGWAVALVVTDAFVGSEHLRAVCQGAQADATVIDEMLSSMPPASEQDINRLATIFHWAWAIQQQRSDDQEVIEDIGRELADSYEEISLLYTITGSMNSVNHPERLVELACDELLATMPYRWIGVQLFVGDRLPRPGKDLVVRGELDLSESQVRSLVTELCADVDRETSLDACAALGPATIVEPIVSDGCVIGAIIAADKRGRDTNVSSVDVKLLSATSAQLAIFLENALLYEDLNATFLGTLEALTATIDAKDRYTCGHSQRVALLTAQLAEAAGLDEDQVDRARIAGLVHDIGKIGVPESVLLKQGRLTDAEFDWIRRHPEIGARILRDIPQMEDVLGGVLHHHERWDGSGYPNGISSEEIPLVARMIALADTFDAMSSTRTYRPAMTHEDVLEEIRREAGSQFDPALAELFLALDFEAWSGQIQDHRAHVPRAMRRERKIA